MKKFLKNKQGITLIALVITIVILVILAAVSINMLIGDNGLITKAHESSKQMQIASGKEEIDLQVLDLVTGKVLKGENCSLEYIKQELPKRLNLSVTGEKGEPLQAIYVDYKNYEYEIDNQFIVKYAGEGNYKERPTLILSLDKTQTGVEKVIITAEAEIIDGTIEEIKNPKGESKKGNNTTYEVTENGEYTFTATSNRGRVTSKTINVNNIKEQGIDLTGIITGADKHNHIYETKYDDNNHWSECIICGNKINVESHNKLITGNPATCDIYVTLGREVCTDNCGYEKQIQRLEHIRPENLKWQDWNSVRHIAFQCERCGGSGSNGLDEEHTFSINGKNMTVNQMRDNGINIHKLSSLQCTKCKLNVDFSKHTFYSNTCYLCSIEYGPTCNMRINDNTLVGNKAKIDLLNNDIQYVYANVNTKGLNFESVDAISLNGGNYNVGTPELVEKQGDLWKYRIPISLKDKNQNITEDIDLLFRWRTSLKDGDIIDDIEIRTDSGIGRIRAEGEVLVMPVGVKPTIDSIEQINEEMSGEWTTKKKLKIKGTCTKREIVYISMYDDTGKTIFENKATQVVDGKYEFISDYGVEAFEERNFTIKVKDMFENEEQTVVALSKIDSQAPSIISNKEYNKEWSKNKKLELEIEEKGIGNVQITFNDENNYQNVEQKDGKYIVNYNFVGDIYEDIHGAIYLKDGLGNIRTEKIKIGKLDNTSPTITNVETKKEGENIVVTINANDINEEIGKEGSGISGYAISTSKELPTDVSYGKSNEIKVEKAGKYYIYVKDNVGNISARYELNIEY